MKENLQTKTKRKTYRAVRILIKADTFMQCEQLKKNIDAKLPVGIQSRGIYLPKSIHSISLLKAPHGYGAHRSTFASTRYKLCVNIGSREKLSSEALKELLTAIRNAKTIPGVSIIIKCNYNEISA